MRDLIRAFVEDESGATFIEYGVIVGMISVVAVLAISTLTGALGDLLGRLSLAMDSITF